MKRIMTFVVIAMLVALPAWTQNTESAPGTAPQPTITITQQDFDALKARLDQLEQEVQRLKAAQSAAPEAESTIPASEESSTTAEPTTAGGGGKQLALPDISLVVQAKGLATDDRNDPAKQKLQLTEAELGIQGYVYPNVKADAFITASPAENESAQVEEAYLTYQGVLKGLNINVGEKHVPFGRTNLLHNHSWLYTRQPLVINNFIAPESLAGQGANFSYLLPTKSNLFAQLDLGVWANGTEGEGDGFDGRNLQPDVIAMGPGANLTDRFETARLWTSYPVTSNSELELGGSWAGGKSNPEPTVADPDALSTDYVHIKGVDMSYRRFGEGSSRLLLRGEAFWRNGTTDSDDSTASGYYLFGNYRWNKYGSLGLLYDWSEFPQNTNLHESAMSLILTKQFSEQYYMRLQAIHGNRPDCGSLNELWLQWCWGVGPHTHNLE